MLNGWWEDETDRPMVWLRVSLLNQLVDSRIPFVVDTGADTTIISPLHARQLGIEYDRLPDPVLVSSLGGPVAAHLTRAAVIFENSDQGLAAYYSTMAILADDTDELSDDSPSLLGRDVLDRVRMISHRAGEGLLIDPLEPDAVA